MSDQNGTRLARLRSRPFVVTVVISALVGAFITSSFDISKWLFFDWLSRDREQSDFRHDINNALRQIERLEKSVAENRTVDLKDKELFRHSLESLKHQLERIELQMTWLHGEGGGDDRRTIKEFFEWKERQRKNGRGWWTPEDGNF